MLKLYVKVLKEKHNDSQSLCLNTPCLNNIMDSNCEHLSLYYKEILHLFMRSGMLLLTHVIKDPVERQKVRGEKKTVACCVVKLSRLQLIPINQRHDWCSVAWLPQQLPCPPPETVGETKSTGSFSVCVYE